MLTLDPTCVCKLALRLANKNLKMCCSVVPLHFRGNSQLRNISMWYKVSSCVHKYVSNTKSSSLLIKNTFTQFMLLMPNHVKCMEITPLAQVFFTISVCFGVYYS